MSRDGLESTGSDPGPQARSPDRDGSLAGRRSRTPPPRQIRRCRRRFRTTATGRISAPSVGSSRTLRPGRACHACCSRARHRPAPCRLLRAWGCLVKGSRVASSYPALLRTALQRSASRVRLRARLDCWTRKIRLTDFCNRLPSRAPCGLLCFRPRLHAAPPPSGGSRFEERKLTLGLSRAA